MNREHGEDANYTDIGTRLFPYLTRLDQLSDLTRISGLNRSYIKSIPSAHKLSDTPLSECTLDRKEI